MPGCPASLNPFLRGAFGVTPETPLPYGRLSAWLELIDSPMTEGGALPPTRLHVTARGRIVATPDDGP
jgi:hypothetical protein